MAWTGAHDPLIILGPAIASLNQPSFASALLSTFSTGQLPGVAARAGAGPHAAVVQPGDDGAVPLGRERGEWGKLPYRTAGLIGLVADLLVPQHANLLRRLPQGLVPARVVRLH